MVTAIGLVVYGSAGTDSGQTDLSHLPYFEAAISSLPIVLTDDTIASAQSLILLSIYHCCLSKPCHALDYCLIASLKVQSLFRKYAFFVSGSYGYVTDMSSFDDGDHEGHERLKRAYWVVLLLERCEQSLFIHVSNHSLANWFQSELRVQFSVPSSDIWSLNDEMPLPDSRRTWQFDTDTGSPAASSTSPASAAPLTTATTDKVQSYFLAEIAMRRMLHRCNTAIRRTVEGKIVYAPSIALELELQLDEWYKYLPDLVRFDFGPEDDSTDLNTTPGLASSTCPLSNFLRVQYHCCKISIYWPAVYQAISDETDDEQLRNHCRRFFDSYTRLIPSLMAAFHECIVNRWTLFASIFMTTMAALKGSVSYALHDSVDTARLRRCFAIARTADRRMITISPSLTLLADTLEEKFAAEYGSPPDILNPHRA